MKPLYNEVNIFEISVMLCCFLSYFPSTGKRGCEDLADIVLVCSIICEEAGSNLRTEGGEEIQLSRAVRQNAFMTPAGVAFCYPDSAPFLPHHPSINPAVDAQSVSICHCPSEVVTFSLHAC